MARCGDLAQGYLDYTTIKCNQWIGVDSETNSNQRLSLDIQRALFKHLCRIAKAFSVFYGCYAMLYTTIYLLASPHSQQDSLGFGTLLSLGSDASSLNLAWAGILSSSQTASPKSLHSNTGRYSSFLPGSVQHAISWSPSDDTIQEIGPRNATFMTEKFFLSKAFAQSMQPSQIVPFYYRESSEFEKDDVTITTLVTSNRFKVFSQLVERYQGMPIRS